MSYDVSIGDYSFNHTSNLGPYFRRHFPGDQGIPSLDGMTGKKAAQACIAFIVSAITEIGEIGKAEVSLKYDPENGWGSTETAIQFVIHMIDGFSQEPRKMVHVWY